MVETYIPTEVTSELRQAMDRLVPQLSTSNPPPTVTAGQVYGYNATGQSAVDVDGFSIEVVANAYHA